MNSLNSTLQELLCTILADSLLHARWLNTLSYMENCGARMIAACEHPTLVKREMLKHAAEEFRHAHHLKKQIQRVSSEPFEDYRPELLLGDWASLHYLKRLNLLTCRYLQTQELSGEAAYLLVTYAIELRAEQLYPIYDELLRQTRSKVVVKCILLEEKGHLEDMREGLETLPNGSTHANEVVQIEQRLCNHWLQALRRSIEEIHSHAMG